MSELLGYPHQGREVAQHRQDAGEDEDFHLNNEFERTYQFLPLKIDIAALRTHTFQQIKRKLT